MSVNSQNFAVAAGPAITVIAPQTVASAGATNSSAVDLESVAAAEEVGFTVLAGTLGTSGTLALKIQGSANNSNWYDIPEASMTVSAAQFAAGLTAPNLSIGRSLLQSLLYAAQAVDCRYVRLVVTTSASNATIAAVYHPFQLKEQPAYGKVNGTDFLAMSN